MSDLTSLHRAAAPHIHSGSSVSQMMLDVLIALCPALAISVFIYGPRAMTVSMTSVLACIALEWLFELLLRRAKTTNDLSAAVTGLLVAFVLPVTTPFWMILLADALAVIVFKQLFGGLGRSMLNPTLAARGCLMLAFPGALSVIPKIRTTLPLFTQPIDVITTATPLMQMQQGRLPDTPMLYNALGMVGGALGEISALAITAGGLYLIYRRVISPYIPLCYIGAAAATSFLLPQVNAPLVWTADQILSGGLLLGAFFMATDPSTSPMTSRGRIVYGLGCGVLTILFRRFTPMPEGVVPAILLMNLLSRPLERLTMKRRRHDPI